MGRSHAGLSLCLVVLTACTPLKTEQSALNLPETLFTAGDGSLIPPTDKISPGCLDQPEFDACIFLKNPVAQSNGAVNIEDLEQHRLFGVKIRGLSTSGFLENKKLQVLTVSSPRFTLQDARKFKSGYSASESYLEQVMAYYWANRTLEYLTNRLGESRVPLSPLKIYADDAFTGYSSTRNSIHLEKGSGVPKAFSAEVLIHLLGQALAQDLAGRALFPGSDMQHKSCGVSPRGCCAGDAGCSQALAAAFGDYVAAMMFPASPKLGETVAQSVAGQSVCAIPRDLSSLGARPKSEVHSACAGHSGYAPLMGSWYASQWWRLRQQVAAVNAEAAADIDVIFFEHARRWTAQSTFAEAKAAALSVAASYKNGAYMPAITAGLSSL